MSDCKSKSPWSIDLHPLFVVDAECQHVAQPDPEPADVFSVVVSFEDLETAKEFLSWALEVSELDAAVSPVMVNIAVEPE